MSNKKWLENENDPEDDKYEFAYLKIQCKLGCINRVGGGGANNTIAIGI